LAEEVAVVGSRCRGLVVEVDLDSGEPGSECSLEPVGDEEEFVGGGEDGFVEGRGVGFAGDEICVDLDGRMMVGGDVGVGGGFRWFGWWGEVQGAGEDKGSAHCFGGTAGGGRALDLDCGTD